MAALALVFALPILVVVGSVFFVQTEVWQHLASTVLPTYLVNSLILAVGVGIGVFIIGTGTAWLCAVCTFPGKRFFEWALILPLAVPGYIIAYTYTGLLDDGGPIQSTLRDLTGWSIGDYYFPQIRSITGAIIMLTLVLYPYVYMLARAAFLEQSASALNVGRSLGLGPYRMFTKVALPLARPAIVAGLSLAIMETLADYGTVQYFGIQTLTIGIFRTWFGLGDPTAAAQLSAILLTFVFVVVVLERLSRRKARYQHHGHWQARPTFVLSGTRGWLATLACALPLLLGFLLPALMLARWTFDIIWHTDWAAFAVLTSRSVMLAAITAILALILALIFAYGQRLLPGRFSAFMVRFASMGYAIPGTVIAVGVIIPFAAFDNTLDSWMRAQFGFSTGLILSGTLAALIFAYLVRFLAVSFNTVEAGLGRVRPSMDDAARSMGLTPKTTLRRVHLPLIRGSLLTASLLVFVDVLKELPATLVLRPFDFNTLAVRTFELASDERLADASLPALMIVLAGLIPVILISRSITHAGDKTNSELTAAPVERNLTKFTLKTQQNN
ncbi:MAG TPA: iron ABC transporter permease [Halothiobacillaceae bacterium]|nr:iron ABC transporter permease [Halothiobacillaceae bacterium]